LREEKSLLGRFASIPKSHVVDGPSVETAIASESWGVDAEVPSVFAEAVARLPHWPTVGSKGGGSTGSYSETVLTTSPGTPAQESVTVSVMSDGRDGSTLSVSVQVAYRPAKPAAERVPHGGVLIATLQPAPDATPVPVDPDRKIITSAAKIAQIADEINALPAEPAYGVYVCPAVHATATLTLEFAPSSAAPASASTVVAVSSQPSGACSPGVQVTVDGTSEQPLDDSMRAGLFAELERLVGVTG
jgi:hypothetical protein